VPANLPSRPPNSLNVREEHQVPAKVDVLVPSLKGLRSEFVEHVRSRIPVHCILNSSVIGPARARQELMERVDTDWFALVDDNVKLRPDWWPTVTGMIGPDVGGVEGLWSYLAGDKRVADYTRAMARLARSGTCNTTLFAITSLAESRPISSTHSPSKNREISLKSLS